MEPSTVTWEERLVNSARIGEPHPVAAPAENSGPRHKGGSLLSPLSRFLTEEWKLFHLQEWAAAKTTHRRPVFDPGGHGWADPEVFDLCDGLNALPGVVTLQSCCGHKLTDASDGTQYLHPAHFWIWMDEERSRVFDRRAPLLACQSLIETVERVYGPERTFASVRFHGVERGCFSGSADALLAFFSNVATVGA